MSMVRRKEDSDLRSTEPEPHYTPLRVRNGVVEVTQVCHRRKGVI